MSRQIAWLREGFPPFRRVGRLATAHEVDCAYGLMVDGQAAFSIAATDPYAARVLPGMMVEIRTVKAAGYELVNNERTATSSAPSYVGGAAYTIAQSFRTPPVGYGLLSSVDLPLSKAALPTGNLAVKLWSDSGGLPSAVLATATTLLDVSTLTATEAWKSFVFSPAVELDANTLYHIAWDISGLTHSGTNYVRWYATPSYALPGTESYSIDGGASWTPVAAYDMKLRFGYEHVGVRTVCLLPPWIGWVERPQYDRASGTVEVNCIDIAGKMGQRHSGLTSSRSGAAGLIARDLLLQANARNAFGLVWDPTSEAGMPVSDIDLSGSSLLDALNQLAEVSGDEWWIRTEVAHDNLEMYLHWAKQQGVDRSQQVVLREGQEISGFTYGQDALSQAESVLVIGGDASEGAPAMIRATTGSERVMESGAMVQKASETYRRATPLSPALAAEQIVVAPLETDLSVLAQRAQQELELPRDAMETMQLTVTERADWSRFAIGDTLRIKAGSTPWGVLDRKIRIMEMQPGDGEMLMEVQVLAD